MSSSCEYGSSQSEGSGSCAGSEDGDGEGDGDGNGDHEGIMDNSSSMRESEHDKISGKDSNEDNCEAFYEFVKMVEQDNEVAGSFIGHGDSET